MVKQDTDFKLLTQPVSISACQDGLFIQ